MYQIIIIIININNTGQKFYFSSKIEKSKTFCIVLYCLNRRIVIQESHKSCTNVAINKYNLLMSNNIRVIIISMYFP